MNIAIVGGTGFVGRNVAEALIDRGHAVRLLSRSQPADFDETASLEFRHANVGNAESLVSVFDDIDAVVYSVGILREDRKAGQSFEAVQLRGVENVVREAQAAGVKRFVLLSANGVREDGTAYQATKFRAEQIVSDSGMDYSIIRPSVIVGDSGRTQEFSWQLYRDIVRPPLPAPEFVARWLPPRRDVMMSPVAIDDVVDVIVRQIENPTSDRHVFELGGPEDLSWRQMLERIAEATGHRKLFVPVPISLMKLPAAVFGRFSFFPVSTDQLSMLAEGNVVPADNLRALIGREPLRFEPANLAYLRDETV